MNTLFVYGTLKKGHGANRKLEGQEFVGEFLSQPIFRMWGPPDVSYPMLTLDYEEGHSVLGEVYKVDDETLSTCDSYEGYPHYYNRMRFPVLGLREPVWIYYIREQEMAERLGPVELTDIEGKIFYRW